MSYFRNFRQRGRFAEAKPFTEQAEQERVAEYIDTHYPDILWTASCGGMKTGIKTAVKMKRAGYKCGTPDIIIFEPRKDHRALLIEIKRPAIQGISEKGTPSKAQLEFLRKAMRLGYLTAICYGSEEAIKVIDDYFEETK